MAQYAVLIYAQDSAHAPDATPQDTESCDRHSDELAESGSMFMAYVLRRWPSVSQLCSNMMNRSNA